MNNLKRQYLAETPRNFKHGLEILYGKHSHTTISNTYYKNGTKAVGIGKFRTLNSVYKILKGYFPNLKLQTLVDYILNEKSRFGFLGCEDLKDITILGGHTSSRSIFNYQFNKYKYKYEAVFN
jgi:hypothetical protein